MPETGKKVNYQVLEDIDWQTWQPVDVATLCFVIKDGQVLLIRKKRGLGAGKINGPGGRVEPGETPLEGAIREVEEELLVTPTGVKKAGELRFQFTNGYSIHGHVFTAEDCHGEPSATDEADPIWTSLDEVPFEEMWEDDIHWFPMMVEGRPFSGHFLFDDDTMLGHRIDERHPG